MTSAVDLAPGRVIVGIGEWAVTGDGTPIVTHALGSCIAVCLWDPVVRVSGLLHFLLADSRINRERAAHQPGTFADTGIPALFQAAYQGGASKARCRVWIVGGADTRNSGTPESPLEVGKRNILAAKNLLWRNGVLLQGEEVGGTAPRNVTVAGGRVIVTTHGRSPVTLT